MHGEQGQDGWEPWGDDAECGKSCGLRRMSQHSLRVLWDVTGRPLAPPGLSGKDVD